MIIKKLISNFFAAATFMLLSVIITINVFCWDCSEYIIFVWIGISVIGVLISELLMRKFDYKMHFINPAIFLFISIAYLFYIVVEYR